MAGVGGVGARRLWGAGGRRRCVRRYSCAVPLEAVQRGRAVAREIGVPVSSATCMGPSPYSWIAVPNTKNGQLIGSAKARDTPCFQSCELIVHSILAFQLLKTDDLGIPQTSVHFDHCHCCQKFGLLACQGFAAPSLPPTPLAGLAMLTAQKAARHLLRPGALAAVGTWGVATAGR